MGFSVTTTPSEVYLSSFAASFVPEGERRGNDGRRWAKYDIVVCSRSFDDLVEVERLTYN